MASKVDDKYAGKKGKCPFCKEEVVVPKSKNSDPVNVSVAGSRTNSINRQSSAINSRSSQHEETPPKTPVIVWCLCGISLAFVISLMLYVFVFRDTWELDHYSELSSLMDDANRLYQVEEYQAGLRKYQELCSLIGDRKLQRDIIKNNYADICKKYEDYKAKLKNELAEAERRRKAREQANRMAEIAREKADEQIRIKEAKRREIEKKAELARKLEIQRERRKEEAEYQQRQLALEQKRDAYSAYKRNLPHLVVQNIINKSSTFRNATYIGNTNKGGGEVSYNYEVEYLTQGGFVGVGMLNVAIVNGQCREVYFNGAEIWTVIMDPNLKGYRNP